MTCSCDDHQPAAGTRRPVARRTILAGGLAAGLTPFVPGWLGTAGAQGVDDRGSLGVVDTAGSIEGYDTPTTKDFGFLPPRPASEVHQNNIMFPVLPDATLGKATWTDTYLAPRSDGRKHEGQDLMGKKMLKLLACVSGTIVELRHQAGGNSLYLKGDDGYYYCYLHINNDTPGTDNASNLFANAFAPGMAVGTRVTRGQHIAYLGDSGNAEATGAHCHFEIRLPNAKWYNAAACNAKYSLQAAEPAKLGGSGPSFAPFKDALAFVEQQAADFLGGTPSWEWLGAAHASVKDGSVPPDAFIEKFLTDPLVTNVWFPVIRLHVALYGFIPTYASVTSWVALLRGGRTLASMADQIAVGATFTNKYGRLDNRGFARQLQTNLTGAAPQTSTLNALTAQLDGGMTRGALALQQCESAGWRTASASRVRVITIYQAMMRRSPDASQLANWSTKDASSSTAMRTLINGHRTGAPYAARFR